ncbi:MAG: General transcription factor IIF subunit 1 [Paramarteilia canceri]
MKLPEYGEGSAFNLSKRDKSTSKMDSEEEKSELNFVFQNNNKKRHFRVTEHKGFDDHSGYFIMQQKDNQTVEMIPVTKWILLKNIVSKTQVPVERIEEAFNQREALQNQYNQIFQNKIDQIQNNEFIDYSSLKTSVNGRKNEIDSKKSNKTSNSANLNQKINTGNEDDDGETNDVDYASTDPEEY